MARNPKFKPTEYVVKNVEKGDWIASYNPVKNQEESIELSPGDKVFVAKLEDPNHLIVIAKGRACDIKKEKFEVLVANEVFMPCVEE